jgi:fructose-1,6-bisphosphatase/inositol monophosphatase family enzyme
MTDPRDDLSLDERRHLLHAALEMRDLCREVIASVMASGFEVDAKSDASLVTTADLETERAFRLQVQTRFPEAGLLGEEFGAMRPDADLQWVIDPIDGTAEFASHLPLWGTIIGLWYRGEPVLGVIDHPGMGECVHAAYGLGAWSGERRVVLDDLDPAIPGHLRRLGTPSRYAFVKLVDEGYVYEALTRAHPNCRTFHTCYAHTCATTGALDASLEWNVPLWDIGATRVCIEEAGGRYECIRETDRGDLGTVRCVVFGRPRMVDEVVGTLAAALERSAAGAGHPD